MRSQVVSHGIRVMVAVIAIAFMAVAWVRIARAETAVDASTAEAQPAAEVKTESTLPGAETTETIAKASQNPIADLVTIPIRNTINFKASTEHNKIQNLTTLIPTFPFRVSEKWNIIFRTTIPILYQPSLSPGTSAEYGVSDINLTAFVARAESRKLLWGLGPTLMLPTAMERTLGTGKWSAGPAIAVVASPQNWVLGLMAYNLWSFAGYRDRASVNQFMLQTFVNYNLPHGWYLTTAPFLSANWKLPNDDRWMVPVGGGFGKIVRTKRLTLDLQTQAFYYVQRPRSESEWSLLLQLKFLFPKTWLTYQKRNPT